MYRNAVKAFMAVIALVFIAVIVIVVAANAEKSQETVVTPEPVNELYAAPGVSVEVIAQDGNGTNKRMYDCSAVAPVQCHIFVGGYKAAEFCLRLTEEEVAKVCK